VKTNNAEIVKPDDRNNHAADGSRLAALDSWLGTTLRSSDYQLAPASADASFRRYFRITIGDQTLIVMDAPPAQEDCRPFIKVSAMMIEAGIHAPKVLAQDLDQGFLLLTDLGPKTYLNVLDESNADALFRDASDALVKWQLASKPHVLPPYDDSLLRGELHLFPDWYVAKHLKVTLTDAQQKTLHAAFDTIIAANLSQANVFVHRDYMPRNLMVSSPNPGVLDFQDAVYGPIGYDIAALFKDAFISWEEERVLDGTIRYWERARKAGLPVPQDFSDFYRDVEWMGLQRHLKVIGIFARINYRDGKPAYLADVPRFVRYVRKVGERYQALFPLIRLFDQLKIDDGVERATGISF
jgi:hypothetical protein